MKESIKAMELLAASREGDPTGLGPRETREVR